MTAQESPKPLNIFDEHAAKLREMADRMQGCLPDVAAGMRQQAKLAQRQADQIRAETAAREGR